MGPAWERGEGPVLVLLLIEKSDACPFGDKSNSRVAHGLRLKKVWGYPLLLLLKFVTARPSGAADKLGPQPRSWYFAPCLSGAHKRFTYPISKSIIGTHNQWLDLKKRLVVRFPAAKSPLYLMEHLPSGQPPHVLWPWPIGLLPHNNNWMNIYIYFMVAPTLFCLVNVGHHLEFCVALTFRWPYCFLPTKLYHILRCA